MLHGVHVNYSPKYVKLARILHDKIEACHYQQGEKLPAAGLSTEHQVSERVVRHALETLAANRYVWLPGAFTVYVVTSNPDT